MNKKFTYLAAMAIAFGMTACGGQKKQEAEPVAETPATPVYKDHQKCLLLILKKVVHLLPLTQIPKKT